jgi:hypothetical protein
MLDAVGWNRKTALVLLLGVALITGMVALVAMFPMSHDPADATAITYGTQGVSITEFRVPHERR